jgi:ribosomal protein L11 methylase PrmA
MTQTPTEFDPGSFRDRDGRVFLRDGKVYRVLSATATADWQALSATRFFPAAVDSRRVVATRESIVDASDFDQVDGKWASVLEHERIPFVSYPYEWTFGMLRDAALLQLDLLLEALEEDLILKDASAYNVQWFGSQPTLIDIPSFQRWKVGDPWVGYQQFCQLFLYPLMLTSYRGVPFQPWLRGSIDGITPESCNQLLSGRDRLRRGVLTHVYLQHKLLAATGSSDKPLRQELKSTNLGKSIITRNVNGLKKLVTGLQWATKSSEWSGYADANSYSDEEVTAKRKFVSDAAASKRWPLAWDLGCNTGDYSRLVAEHSDHVVAMDADVLAVEKLYRALSREENTTILPLSVNLADPSPNLGWRGRERRSLPERGTPDLTLCLALIHHMVITANIPVDDFVSSLAELGSHIIIEFPTRKDPMVKRLLRTKEDIFDDYNLESFEASIGRRFQIIDQLRLPGNTRVLYFLRPAADSTGIK